MIGRRGFALGGPFCGEVERIWGGGRGTCIWGEIRRWIWRLDETFGASNLHKEWNFAPVDMGFGSKLYLCDIFFIGQSTVQHFNMKLNNIN